MKKYLLIAVLFASCHTPTQWELATQGVAHNGDSTGVLFDAMRKWDSIMAKRHINASDDSAVRWFNNYLSKEYLPNKTFEEQEQCMDETQRWADNQYSFAYDYYTTSTHSFLNDNKIYSIPIYWWHHKLAPTK